MTPEIAEQLKNTLTTLVEQDGGSIELVQFTNDSMEFNLLLDSAECAECIMPKQFLEEVFLAQAMKKSSLPKLRQFMIIYDRF